MFSHVKHKICSQRGASLSMALMLFLVCTVVASIVLAAGSAAAGRVSQLKEMEKSYCNVSSAAGLLWDELKQDQGGAEVHIVRICDSLDDDLVPNEEASYSFLVDGEPVPSSLFQKIACDWVFGTNTTLDGDEYQLDENKIKASLAAEDEDGTHRLFSLTDESKQYGQLNVSVKDSETGDKLAGVIIKVTCENDGDLLFSLEDGSGQSFHASIMAKMGIDDLAPRITRKPDGIYRAEYETVITWDGESIQVGGVSS